jgi:hypothetical protein
MLLELCNTYYLPLMKGRMYNIFMGKWVELCFALYACM